MLTASAWAPDQDSGSPCAQRWSFRHPRPVSEHPYRLSWGLSITHSSHRELALLSGPNFRKSAFKTISLFLMPFFKTNH